LGGFLSAYFCGYPEKSAIEEEGVYFPIIIEISPKFVPVARFATPFAI
jgi:hypothetical protein